jgi:hypothetical protein
VQVENYLTVVGADAFDASDAADSGLANRDGRGPPLEAYRQRLPERQQFRSGGNAWADRRKLPPRRHPAGSRMGRSNPLILRPLLFLVEDRATIAARLINDKAIA